MELKTYGELKKLIKLISLKQKGEKIISQGKELALDQLLGLIPGASNAKTALDFLTSAFKKPDTVKTNTWLDRLDIDDKMSAIVDDTVENGFLQFLSKTLEAAPDDKPLQPNFNMNQEMSNYLKNTYGGRFVTGIRESTIYNKKRMKKVLITESQLRGMVRKMLNEIEDVATTKQTMQPKVSPAAQSVINIINGPNGNTLLASKLQTIKNPNDLTAIINFITSKTSVNKNATASVGRNVASGFKNIQTQAGL